MANVSVDRVESALDLVTVIADPARAKAALEEMRAQAANLQKMIADHRDLADSNAAAVADLEKREQALSEREAALNASQDRLAALETSVKAHQGQLESERAAFEMDALQKSKALDNRQATISQSKAMAANAASAKEAELSRRSKAMETKELELANREIALAAGEKDYAARMTKLKELVG